MSKTLLASTAATALLALTATSFAEAPANLSPVDSAACAKISEKEVADLFKVWADAAATGKGSAVAATYAPDAVLLPTVQNKPATNTAEITAYFDMLLQKKPSAEINTRTIKIGCNMAIDVGTWTFTLDGENGQRVKVPARYSFVYQYRDGKWQIAHHHSSKMPEQVTN